MKPGTVLCGKYRLERMLGQGGMGSVWQAEHLGLRAPVAVKLMDPLVTQNADALARFHREAHAAAMIRSPHVVQVLDHGVDEATHTPFIVMELLEGETLGECLMREQMLSPARTAAILGDVCRALARAHQAGIIHRDLKPDNIFLVSDDREYAKVVDFGVAKSRPYSVGAGGTRTGALIGTPYYMSPEQISGSKQIDGRSDLWSVAVIACECITGRRPFQEETIGGLALAICTRPVPRALELGPVNPSFDRWLARALNRNPAERFQTARELADSLTEVCAGNDRTIVERPKSVRDVTRGEDLDTLPGRNSAGRPLTAPTLPDEFDSAPTGRPDAPSEEDADNPTAPPLSNTFAADLFKYPRPRVIGVGLGIGLALVAGIWLAVDAGQPLHGSSVMAARLGDAVRRQLAAAQHPEAASALAAEPAIAEPNGPSPSTLTSGASPAAPVAAVPSALSPEAAKAAELEAKERAAEERAPIVRFAELPASTELASMDDRPKHLAAKHPLPGDHPAPHKLRFDEDGVINGDALGTEGAASAHNVRADIGAASAGLPRGTERLAARGEAIAAGSVERSPAAHPIADSVPEPSTPKAAAAAESRSVANPNQPVHATGSEATTAERAKHEAAPAAPAPTPPDAPAAMPAAPAPSAPAPTSPAPASPAPAAPAPAPPAPSGPAPSAPAPPAPAQSKPPAGAAGGPASPARSATPPAAAPAPGQPAGAQPAPRKPRENAPADAARSAEDSARTHKAAEPPAGARTSSEPPAETDRAAGK
jgi:serine/threonine protein kinase